MGHLKCWQFLSVKDFLDFLIKIFTSYFWTSVSVLFLNKQYLSIDYFWNPPYKSCLNPLSCCVDQKSWGSIYLKTVSITNLNKYQVAQVTMQPKSRIWFVIQLHWKSQHVITFINQVIMSVGRIQYFSLPSLRCTKGYPTSDLES